jgi:hypothetical protein
MYAGSDDGVLHSYGTWNTYTGEFDVNESYPQPTTDKCLGAKTAPAPTTTHYLTTTLDMRKAGLETNRISMRFMMMVPGVKLGSTPIKILQWGANNTTGTITLTYFPITGNSSAPHVLTASIYGDTPRIVTCPINRVNAFTQVYLEYDGTVLTLVCGAAGDQYTATFVVALPTSPNTLRFATDAAGWYFKDLELYNAALLESSNSTETAFPYMLWDAATSGVVAVIPTPTIPSDYFVFIDRGFTAGHKTASIDLTTANTIIGTTLYVNERPMALGFGGGTAAQFVTWLTTTNGGVVTFPFDGKLEQLKFTVSSGNIVTAVHKRGAVLGQMSFAVRIEGTRTGGSVTGGSWSKTVPILGKIPGQFFNPHTGEPNKGISIMGTDKVIQTPKALNVEYRDDNVRTVGKMIGDIGNRPGAGLALQRLEPTNFFGSNKAPFPKDSMVYGNPNTLAATLSDDNIYAYGLAWERFMSISPLEARIRHAPANRSRVGDTIAAFSIDIPLGQTLRGLDICFTAAPPGLRGNSLTSGNFYYEWGEGIRQFPFLLTGGADYTCLYYLMVATDTEATKWTTLPSLGVDAVKVGSTTTWKEVQLKSVDFSTLKDDVTGLPLLMGGRRIHFKLVLAHELSACTYQGASYMQSATAKK